MTNDVSRRALGTVEHDAAALEEAVDAMERYSMTHGGEAHRLGSFWSFMREAKELVTSVKMCVRRFRDHAPHARDDWTAHGSPRQVIHHYYLLAGWAGTPAIAIVRLRSHW